MVMFEKQTDSENTLMRSISADRGFNGDIMRIGVITPGGDAPGMNACIRAVVRKGIDSGIEIYGINRGYTGLLENDIIPLNKRSVSGIIHHGGTMLKSSRCIEIRTDGGIKSASGILNNHRIEYLVVIGGDGSFVAANKISKRSGAGIIGIPATIDNDIYGTDETIGFDTALDTAVESIDKIRDTATSFERVFLIEVMGREHGFLAIEIGLASGAEFVLIPEVKHDVRKISSELKKYNKSGKTSAIIVFAEGAGDVRETAEKLESYTGFPARVSSLGYIQRGGTPSGRSRILGTLFGTYAIDLIKRKKKNRVVVVSKCRTGDIPIETVISKEKKINLLSYRTIHQTAGIF